jgi:spore coat protein U-like protein
MLPWALTVRGPDVGARANRIRGHRRAAALLFSACWSATVSSGAWADCTVSAIPVNFGLYNPLTATPNVATGTVTMTCTVLLGLFESWTIALSPGNSNNFTTRKMLNGTSPLSYNLYTTAAYSNVWGDGSGSTAVISGNALLSIGTSVYPYTVYGRIPAGQDSAAGSFLDTIVVTLNF